MAFETFHTLIARNKRNSVLLIAGFMLFFFVVGTVIGMAWFGTTRWSHGMMVAGVAMGIALLVTLFSWFGGSETLMAISGARKIRKEDDLELFNVVEEMCIAGGLPMPQVYVINDTAMNAFATGRDPKHAAVAITVGLRTRLTRSELQAVIAHELSHIRHYDIRYAMLMAIMVGGIVLMCDLFLRSTFWFGGAGSRRRRSSNREGGGGAVQLVLLVVAVILAILAPILAKLIQMALSRQREYLADAGSVELTRNPDSMIGALAKLNADEEVLEVANRATAPLYIVHPIRKFEARAKSIFCTHPPIEDRIKRIASLAG